MVRSVGDRQCTDLCGIIWPGLRSSLRSAASRGVPFSHVIILAGTNDLAGERILEIDAIRRSTMILEVNKMSGARNSSFRYTTLAFSFLLDSRPPHSP
jgi:hypothetical protein